MYKKYQKLLYSKAVFFCGLVLTLLIYLFYALEKNQLCDFVAINGTFQNYNVIRRFLDGQVPFRDFTIYLGFGQLCLGSLFTFLLGGSFADSILAMQLLSSLTPILFSYTLSWLFFKRNALIPFVFANSFIFYINLSSSCYWLVNTGNSARLVRGAILPIAVLLVLLIQHYKDHLVHKKPEKVHLYRCEEILLYAAVTGVAFIWGNDYGLCTWLCGNCMVLLLTLLRTKKILPVLRNLMLLAVGNAITVLLLLTVLTRGNALAWLQQNFTSSGYQSWYFNRAMDKHFYWFELDFQPYALISLCLCVCYFVRLFQHRSDEKLRRRNGIMAFVHMTTFAAVQEYQLFGGGGSALFEIVTITDAVSLAIEGFCFISANWKKISPKPKQVITFVTVCSMLLITLLPQSINLILLSSETRSTAVYQEKLGGYISDEQNSEIEFFDGCLDGKTLFSPYASAAELVTGQFQPTGTDYIIHVLSDKDREQYMECLHSGNFDYATTIQENYTRWGEWIRNANWFYYREIYENYQIVFKNKYEIFWKKHNDGDRNIADTGISVNVKQISDQEVEISITTDEPVDGIADLYIDYDSEIQYSLLGMLVHSNVVEIHDANADTDHVDAWCLRPISAEYIPVEVRNGVGSVTITSYPIRATKLVSCDASCEQILIPWNME